MACPCYRQDTGGPGGAWEGLSARASRPFRSDLLYRRYGPATLAECPEAGGRTATDLSRDVRRPDAQTPGLAGRFTGMFIVSASRGALLTRTQLSIPRFQKRGVKATQIT